MKSMNNENKSDAIKANMSEEHVHLLTKYS